MGSINFAAPFQLLHPIDVDPLKYATQYANLANLAQERQVRQQQIAASQQAMQLNAITLQEHQQQLQDQQTIQNLVPQMRNDPQYLDKDGNLDWEGKVLPALQGKITPNTYDALEKNILANHQTHLTIQKDLADLDQKKQDLDAKHQDLMIKANDAVANGALDWAQHGKNPAVLDGLLHQWEDLYSPMKGSIENARQAIAADPSRAEGIMADLGSRLSVAGQQARAGLAETGAKQKASEAQALKDNAQARIDTAKANAMDAMKTNPQAGVQSIIGMFPQGSPQADVYVKRYNSALQLGDFEGARSAIDAASTAANQRLEKLDPAVLKTELGQAVARDVAVKTATAPIEQANAAALARAMAGGVGDYANVAPKDIDKTRAAYQKSGENLVNAAAAADEMQNFINMARGGNKIAYAYAPTTGVLTINSANGTRRINTAEVGNYAGAGSDWDRVQQFFGKHLTGESIDKDILDAMEQTHQGLFQSQYQKHVNEVNMINKVNGSTLKPMDDIKPKAAGGTVAPIKLKDGRTLTPHDAAAAAAFRKDHADLIAPGQ